MSSGSNAPVIIKRRKVIAVSAHHGGAWKVAYADFVTAMMAFFMLMWLLNATTENQRKGLADYFNPSIPIARISGGGKDMLQGDTVTSAEPTAGSTAGQDILTASAAGTDGSATPAEPLPKDLAEIDKALSAASGESTVSDELLRHIVTRVTDEGLIVDLFDLPGATLFVDGTAQPTPLMRELIDVVSEIFALARNEIAVNGHVTAMPVVIRETRVWDRSAARAQATRALLTRRHLDQSRIQRIGGFADRQPTQSDPMDVRNNRVEIILLR